MSNSGTSEITGRGPLEGVIVSGRNWNEQKEILGITEQLLAGKKILNFGAGVSNLRKDLIALGIDCKLTDVDLTADNSINTPSIKKFFKLLKLDKELKNAEPGCALRKDLVKQKRILLATEGREFAYADGRHLPFPDNQFDVVMASWSTYQIPLEDREVVFDELLRVGKALHLSPILGEDYDLIKRAAWKRRFDIVACVPIDDIDKKKIYFSSPESYDSFMMEHPEDERIFRPKTQHVTVEKIGPFTLPAFAFRINTIILKKAHDFIKTNH